MKKLIFLLLCALLLLTGCTAKPPSPLSAFSSDMKSPCLIPVEATDDSLRMLDVLGQHRKHDSVLFDFIAPADTKHLIITQWELSDGQWQIYESDKLALDAVSGRIALSWTQLYQAANIVLQAGDRTIAVSHDNPPLPARTGVQTMTMLQSMETPLTLETEFPLMMEVITNQETSPVQPLECWQEVSRYTGHESVCLVTLRFSATPLE